MHRIASSKHYPGISLIEIQTQWSLDDLLDANEVIDLFEEAEHKAYEEVQKKHGRKRA